LLWGDTERSAALRHEIPIPIGDGFLFAEAEGKTYVVTSRLEIGRLARALPDAKLSRRRGSVCQKRAGSRAPIQDARKAGAVASSHEEREQCPDDPPLVRVERAAWRSRPRAASRRALGSTR